MNYLFILLVTMKCYYLLSDILLMKIGRGGKAEGKKRYPAQNILSID